MVATSVLGSVVCLTQNSPPTTVSWTRDGVAIQMDGVAYDMIQQVIERQSYSRYNNTLLIRDAIELAGDHSYCCIASNYAGNSTPECVNTTWSGKFYGLCPYFYYLWLHKAQPEVVIAMPEEALYSKPFQATCIASLQPRVAPYLTQYLTVEWMGAEGEYLSPEDGITIEEQKTSSTAATRALVIDSLSMFHGGNYTCEANVVLPDTVGSFNTTHQYHLDVLSKAVIFMFCL